MSDQTPSLQDTPGPVETPPAPAEPLQPFHVLPRPPPRPMPIGPRAGYGPPASPEPSQDVLPTPAIPEAVQPPAPVSEAPTQSAVDPRKTALLAELRKRAGTDTRKLSLVGELEKRFGVQQTPQYKTAEEMPTIKLDPETQRSLDEAQHPIRTKIEKILSPVLSRDDGSDPLDDPDMDTAHKVQNLAVRVVTALPNTIIKAIGQIPGGGADVERDINSFFEHLQKGGFASEGETAAKHRKEHPESANLFPPKPLIAGTERIAEALGNKELDIPLQFVAMAGLGEVGKMGKDLPVVKDMKAAWEHTAPKAALEAKTPEVTPSPEGTFTPRVLTPEEIKHVEAGGKLSPEVEDPFVRGNNQPLVPEAPPQVRGLPEVSSPSNSKVDPFNREGQTQLHDEGQTASPPPASGTLEARRIAEAKAAQDAYNQEHGIITDPESPYFNQSPVTSDAGSVVEGTGQDMKIEKVFEKMNEKAGDVEVEGEDGEKQVSTPTSRRKHWDKLTPEQKAGWVEKMRAARGLPPKTTPEVSGEEAPSSRKAPLEAKVVDVHSEEAPTNTNYVPEIPPEVAARTANTPLPEKAALEVRPTGTPGIGEVARVGEPTRPPVEPPVRSDPNAEYLRLKRAGLTHEEAYKTVFNPDVETRPRGTVRTQAEIDADIAAFKEGVSGIKPLNEEVAPEPPKPTEPPKAELKAKERTKTKVRPTRVEDLTPEELNYLADNGIREEVGANTPLAQELNKQSVIEQAQKATGKMPWEEGFTESGVPATEFERQQKIRDKIDKMLQEQKDIVERNKTEPKSDVPTPPEHDFRVQMSLNHIEGSNNPADLSYTLSLALDSLDKGEPGWTREAIQEAFQRSARVVIDKGWDAGEVGDNAGDRFGGLRRAVREIENQITTTTVESSSKTPKTHKPGFFEQRRAELLSSPPYEVEIDKLSELDARDTLDAIHRARKTRLVDAFGVDKAKSVERSERIYNDLLKKNEELTRDRYSVQESIRKEQRLGHKSTISGLRSSLEQIEREIQQLQPEIKDHGDFLKIETEKLSQTAKNKLEWSDPINGYSKLLEEHIRKLESEKISKSKRGQKGGFGPDRMGKDRSSGDIDLGLPDPAKAVGKIGQWATDRGLRGKAPLEAVEPSADAGGPQDPTGWNRYSSGAPREPQGQPRPSTTGPGGKDFLKGVGFGSKSIVDSVRDLGGDAAKEMSQRIARGLNNSGIRAADWSSVYDEGVRGLDRESKVFFSEHGTEAVDNPNMEMPDGAREFINNARKEMKTRAGEDLLVEEGGKLRSSSIDPVRHVDHVLTDEATKRYEANDPATIKAWEKVNPGRKYESWIKSKISAVPDRYESDWLKPTNRNALPREVNWPQSDLEQNVFDLDKSYIKRMASHQAQMEHLGISNTDTGEYTGPMGQGRFGELLAEIKAQHGEEAGENVKAWTKNAFGRGERGNVTVDGRLGNKTARIINGLRAFYYFTGNLNALHHITQGGLTAAELARHPSNFPALVSKFMEGGLRGTYKEGVARGAIPRMWRDSPQMEGTDWAGKAEGAGRYINTGSTATYSTVSTAMRTIAYAASENELGRLSEDLKAGGSKELSALHILDDEMKMYPRQIDEIRSGDISDATLKDFQRSYVAKTTGSAIPGEEANWTHNPSILHQFAAFAQRGALATTNMTLRGPIEEAFNGRPQRLATVVAAAYVAAPLVRRGYEGVFGKDKNSAKNLDDIIADGGDKYEILDWLSEQTSKSWMMGTTGRRLAQAGHTTAYGVQHNEHARYVASKALEILLDPDMNVVPQAAPPLYKNLFGDEKSINPPRRPKAPLVGR